MPNRSAARHAIGWLLLIAFVVMGHLLLPWILPLATRHAPSLKNTSPSPALATRQISAPAADRAPTRAPEIINKATPPAVRGNLGGMRARSVDQTPPDQEHERAATPIATDTPQTTPLADEVDAAGKLQYALSGQFGGQPLGGSAALQWQVGKSGYALSLQVTGSRQYAAIFGWKLKTLGIAGSRGLWPESYDEELIFAGTATTHRTQSFPLPAPHDQPAPGIDPLSALVNLANELNSAQQTEPSAEPPAGTPDVSVAVNLGGRTLTLTFAWQGSETIETPFGPLRTEKYVAKYAHIIQNDSIVTIWFAPELRHSPIRIQIDREGVASLKFSLASEPVALPLWP